MQFSKECYNKTPCSTYYSVKSCCLFKGTSVKKMMDAWLLSQPGLPLLCGSSLLLFTRSTYKRATSPAQEFVGSKTAGDRANWASVPIFAKLIPYQCSTLNALEIKMIYYNSVKHKMYKTRKRKM